MKYTTLQDEISTDIIYSSKVKIIFLIAILLAGTVILGSHIYGQNHYLEIKAQQE